MTAVKFGPRHAVPTFVVAVRGELGCMVTRDHSLVKPQADCYLESRPGAVVDVEYYESCGLCQGEGFIRGKRRRARAGECFYNKVTCPTCKGDGAKTPEMRIASYVGPNWSDKAAS